MTFPVKVSLFAFGVPYNLQRVRLRLKKQIQRVLMARKVHFNSLIYFLH